MIFYISDLKKSSLSLEKFQKQFRTNLNSSLLSIVPTETVYGLSANPLDATVYEKINKVKKRQTKKSFVYIVYEKNFFLKMISDRLPDWFLKNIPMPMTIIVNLSSSFLKEFPFFLKNNDKSIALRFVDLFFLKNLSYPPILISTSLNYQNEEILYKKKDILAFYKKHEEINLLLIDDTVKDQNKSASTIIDFRSYPYKILRLGQDVSIENFLNQFRNDLIIN